mgnify:CR=1 FL=1
MTSLTGFGQKLIGLEIATAEPILTDLGRTLTEAA